MNIKNKKHTCHEGTPYNVKIGGLDLTGQTYGILHVIGFEKRDNNGASIWRVQCNKCGSTRIASYTSITKAPQKCGCKRSLGTPRIITIGEGLLPSVSKTNTVKATPPLPFEFQTEPVKKAVINLRKERSEYSNAIYKYRTQGITANRDMYAWRQDMDIREDNITFRLLDMIEELQTKVEGLENELKQK